MKRKPATDRRIEQAYYRTCSGVQINVLDIGRVFAVGRASVAAGDDDEALAAKVAAFVETIRKNPSRPAAGLN